MSCCWPVVQVLHIMCIKSSVDVHCMFYYLTMSIISRHNSTIQSICILQEWTTATIPMHPSFLQQQQQPSPQPKHSQDALPKYVPVPEAASSTKTRTTIASSRPVPEGPPSLRNRLPPSQLHGPLHRPQLPRQRSMARRFIVDTVLTKSTISVILPEFVHRD